jgi:TPR repeat protein
MRGGLMRIWKDIKSAIEGLPDTAMEAYYSCCGKSICAGCIHSFIISGNHKKCVYCNSDFLGKTEEEDVEQIMKRVEANDPASICKLGSYYYNGAHGLQQDREKAMELLTRAADLGFKKAHLVLGDAYEDKGDLKKAKYHYEAAAMAGDEVARLNLGIIERNSGNMQQAVKHWMIAASVGEYEAMQDLISCFEIGFVARESIDSTLLAYNKSCAEIRSEAKVACM